MRQHTGCAGVMVGRGAFGNPWLFRDARALLAGEPRPAAPDAAERFAGGAGARPAGDPAAGRQPQDGDRVPQALRLVHQGAARVERPPRRGSSRSSRWPRPRRSSQRLPRARSPRWRDAGAARAPAGRRGRGPPDARGRRWTGCGTFRPSISTFAQLDHHRALRQGHPEVVFCAGKTVEQVVAICERLAAASAAASWAPGRHRSRPTALRARFAGLEWNRAGAHRVPPGRPTSASRGGARDGAGGLRGDQ